MLKILVLILLYGLFFLMCYLGTGTLKKNMKSFYSYVMKEKTEKVGRMLGKMMKLPGFKRFFLKMWDTMSHKNFGPTAGYCNVFYPKEKNRFKMDITACPYHKYLTELDCPELNILFCDNDIYTYGNLPGMKFIRTKTLGAGGELGDFCMEMEGL